jgi:HK97 family phage major capsid protein
MPTPTEILRLQRELTSKVDRLTDIVDRASVEKRDLSRRERAEVDRITREVEDLRDRIPKFDPRLAQSGIRGEAHVDDVEQAPNLLRPEQRVVDYLREHRGSEFGSSSLYNELLDPTRFSVGRMVRGMFTGEWKGAEMERRAMLEGTSSAGGALLPTPMSGTLIDRIRNTAQVMAAGASTVVMTEQVLFMGRLVGGPSPALSWHSEGQQIPTSDRSVDKITFTAQTLPNLTPCSIELLQDMSDEAAMMIENEIVQSLALEIDRVCLRGAGTGAEPRGIRNTAGVTITSLGANGAPPLWDNVVDGVSTLRNANVQPTAILWASRTQQSFDKYKTAVGEYLSPPPGIADIPRLVTNQIPTNLTQGSSNAASEIYVGAWPNLILGVREQIGFDIAGGGGPTLAGRVRVLQERYIDQGLVGLMAYFRGDVQLKHAEAFNVLTGVTT